MDKKAFFKGYTNELLNYILEKQLLDEDLYRLFVNQYKLHSDTDNGWRGEFWGKTVRSACSIYKINQSKELYNVLKNTVVDLLTAQEKNGRISSYPLEKEFTCWDMWGRKYVMLGMIYFYDICKSESLKRKITKFLEKCASYIMKKIGNGRGKKSIFEITNIYGGLNSCSILSPFVRLYKITNNQKYLDFAKYIIDLGACSSFNILDAANDDSLMPYEFKERKAYELMSCYNGILDYYEITKEEKYLSSVEKFFDKLIKSDYTIIGCCGTDTEFLDNSTLKQTQKTESFSQETCVSVTLLDLSKHLYDLTANTKYIDIIERTSLNAYFGAINNEKQTMKKSRGLVWHGDDYDLPPHGSFPFDSYSPLVSFKRGYQIAGFMMLQDGKSYGCCAAIGGLGLGIYFDSMISVKNNQLFVNLFDTFKTKLLMNNNQVELTMTANTFVGKKAVMKIKGFGNTFEIRVRIPKWMDKVSVYIDNQKVEAEQIDGYISLNRKWNNEKIMLKFVRKFDFVYLNDKVALLYGPIVLTDDERYQNKNVTFEGKIKKSNFKLTDNTLFNSNLHFICNYLNNTYHFVDYAQAGKNFDSDSSNINVWYQIN